MLQVDVIFENPHDALSERLPEMARNCRAAHIVTGFATVDGIRSLPSNLQHGTQLQTFIVGAGTQRAFDALDELLSNGVDKDRLYIHLGHTRRTKDRAKYPFLRYHPMLHSKVYLFEYDNERFSAVIGSHNVTNFALNGLNSEAAVCLSGLTAHPTYTSIVKHIDACRRQAVRYESAKKDAYAWWLQQFADGLAAKAMDRHRDYERQYTLIVICQGSTAPSPGSELYLELPAKLYQQSLSVEVHGYVFDVLPKDIDTALKLLTRARATFTGRLDGLMNKKGAVEILADWHLVGANRALTRTVPPFRPTRANGMQQARVEIQRPIAGTYVYMFDREPTWEPAYDSTTPLAVNESDAAILQDLKLVPEEHLKWYRVVDLLPNPDAPNPTFEAAAVEATKLFMRFSPRRTFFPRTG